MSEGIEFNIDAPDLRALLDHIKTIDAKLATDLRRELRTSGQEILDAQRQILSGPKPGSIRVTGKKLRRIQPKNGRAYLAFRNEYEYGAEKTGGVSDLRAQIADGLRTRIVAGKTRQSVQIKTTGPRNDGYNMALIWQKGKFRHPVFGDNDRWVYQSGQPYFWDPVNRHYQHVRERIKNVVEEALRRIES